MDNKLLNELIGQMTDEKIELPSSVPSFEKTFAETMIKNLINVLKNEQKLINDEASYEIVDEDNKVVAKIKLVFFDENVVNNLINTNGASLNMSQRWNYSKIDNNIVKIVFDVK
jgi:hemolysin-activating ACP:hemolysin acyltransferase